ncbi:hypothetical protein AB0C13_00970 [Streptomyces sp. NPDC049099]|uniref:hypothetical protein n=1 Tax=Streptomyces sp. NPDC049099 TaxID=3155768 RepID=UPI00341C4BE6
MADDDIPVLHLADEEEWLAWATHVRKCTAGCRFSPGEECAEAVPLRKAIHEARARAAES